MKPSGWLMLALIASVAQMSFAARGPRQLTSPCATAMGRTQADTAVTFDVPSLRLNNRLDKTFTGQFLEAANGGIFEGLHAELLEDNGFEEPPTRSGLPPSWQDYPSRRLNNTEWIRGISDDNVTRFHNPMLSRGQHSLYINNIVDNRDFPRGIKQVDRKIHNQKTYQGSVWIKTDPNQPFHGRVRFTLESARGSGAPYAEAFVEVIPGEWSEYRFELTPRLHASQDLGAWFTLQPQGQGALLIDNLSLMPADNIRGMNRAVVQKLKALRPASLREGGIAGAFRDLRDILGPKAGRLRWYNGWEDVAQTSDFGVDEYFGLGEELKSEVTMTLNIHGENGVQEALDLLEYMVGDASTRMGQLRAAHGHPVPYPLTYVELANEPWLGGFQHARPVNAAQDGGWDPVRYASKVRDFAIGLRRSHAYDSIQLLAAGDRSPEWYRPVIEIAGPYITGIVLHWYLGEPNELKKGPQWLMAQAAEVEGAVHAIGQTARELHPDHLIKVIFNEWNARLKMPEQNGMLAGVGVARVWNMLVRNAGQVTMSMNANSVNGWTGSQIHVNAAGDLFVTPIYYINMVYGRRAGEVVLPALVHGPEFTVLDADSVLFNRSFTYLDVAATVSRNGKRLYVKVVNSDPEHSHTLDLSLKGLGMVKRGEWKLLKADNPQVANTFAQPDLIRLEDQPFDPKETRALLIPKLSVSSFMFQLEPDETLTQVLRSP